LARGPGGGSLYDTVDRGGAGRAEYQSDPVDHEAGRERAQQEVLDARLLRFRLGAVERRQHVQRDGEQLEGDEHDDQVGRLDHQHHAEDAEQQQGVILAALQAHALDVAVGQRDAQQPADEQQGVQEDGKAVQHGHVVKAGRLLAGLAEREAERDGQPEGSQQRREALAVLRDEEVREQQHAGPHRQDDDRQEGVVVVKLRNLGHETLRFRLQETPEA
jgi:hypothetical protein